VIAIDSRPALELLRRRLGLESRAEMALVTPNRPEFAAAMELPLRLLWMPLDRYASRSEQWFGEEQLEAMRSSVKVQRFTSRRTHEQTGELSLTGVSLAV
jgi:hypothetical protein